MISALSLHLGVISAILIFLRVQKIPLTNGFGFRHTPLKAAGLGVLSILLYLPIGWGLQVGGLQIMTKLGIEPATQLMLQVLKSAHAPGNIAWLAIVVIIIAPVAEELFFRGVLYPTIKQAGFPRSALWGTSALFAVIHFNVAIFIPLLLLAALLVWLYEKTDNLLAPIAAHVTFNAVNFALFFVAEDFARKLPAQS